MVLRTSFSGDINRFGYKDKDSSANFVKYEIPAYTQKIQFPSMEIDMEVELWGITLICMAYFIEAVMELPTDGLDVEVDPDYVQKQLLHFTC